MLGLPFISLMLLQIQEIEELGCGTRSDCPVDI